MPVNVRRPKQGRSDTHDSAATRQAAAAERTRQEKPAGSDDSDADSWESCSDENDVDERFDEQFNELVVDDGADDTDAEDDDEDEEYAKLREEKKKVQFASADPDIEDDPDDDENGGDGQLAGRVWRRDKDGLDKKEEKLEFSNRAYDSFFQLRSEYPCLSFDVLRDNEGVARTKYPMALSVVCGSQATESQSNQLYVIRVRNLLRTRHDQGDDDESDEDLFGADDSEDDADEEEEEINGGEPQISFQTIKHHGAVNRLRSNPLAPQMIATWSDAGVVQVFDVDAQARVVNEHVNATRDHPAGAASKTPALRFASNSSSHKVEGYGLDWSPVTNGVFASGDCYGQIYVWKPNGARWDHVGGSPMSEGRYVEEIQFSPTQDNVLLAARAGGDVEVWDVRDMRKPRVQWKADPTDINVATWNKIAQSSHLVATGADSGMLAVWDLRTVRSANPNPIQHLGFHQGAAITAIEFNEHNESVLSATSDDGQCTLWDLSLERDPDEEREVMGELFNRQDITALPDQLMFQHQGLEHPKEVHFHPQIPGLVITGDFLGLNFFKPRNWRSLMK